MSPRPETISLQQARRLALRKQLLLGTPLPRGKAGALAAIDALGYVQIDTINVIERAHHVTLFARCPGYHQRHLHDLQARDGKIFEYWAHAMCYLPLADYRFYRRHMETFPTSSAWYRQMVRKHEHLAGDVLRRIRDEGPLTAADFEDTRAGKRGPWWDWKPAKAALEMLYYRGDLMVLERRGFARVYDLTGRVLPPSIDLRRPSPEEAEGFFARRALQGLGAATIGDINKHITIAGKLQRAVDRLVASGEARAIRVEGSDKMHYILSSDLAQIDAVTSRGGEVALLSPFDNAIILRDRVKRLFGFDYTLECYVPPAKRQYGYFCLPMLWREQLVGRIDLKADRQGKKLLVQNLHYERGFKPDDSFAAAFSKSLRRFAEFHDCDAVAFSDRVDNKTRKMLSPSS
ncbi:MAG TPA: crosslink repair DNA glycosylase YcaQ family protein [Candidatus Edwardsbacteria bacterium]|nr:crosslink repair DNA glycosylase YcaQ family protein [Candidatus Edwardsbacteria bacterium]